MTASTRVRVESVTALSRASDRAMATVRGLGGFTVSSDYSVPSGAAGTNVLVFRVPVARAERAIAGFGRLGTVIGQSADIVDVTARLGAEGRAVERLTERVDRLRAALVARPGDQALMAQLERAQRDLSEAEARRSATRGRADLARLDLTLTTEGPPAAPVDEGSLRRARSAMPVPGWPVRDQSDVPPGARQPVGDLVREVGHEPAGQVGGRPGRRHQTDHHVRGPAGTVGPAAAGHVQLAHSISAADVRQSWPKLLSQYHSPVSRLL